MSASANPLRVFKKPPEHAAALARVRGWVRERFRLDDEAAILVAEVACGLPGCPPIETAIAFWTDRGRHQFKVFKPVAEVTADDLPPSWMKNALVAMEGTEWECC
jgi:nitrate reductase delta subunit